MGSKLRCEAKVKRGTRCRRLSSELSVYCKQHANMIKKDTGATKADTSNVMVKIESQESSPESSKVSEESDLESTTPYDHAETYYDDTLGGCANSFKMGVMNDNCQCAKNENFGNMTAHNMVNSPIQQTFNLISNFQDRMPITINDCHPTLHNIIYYIGPALLDQAKRFEHLIDKTKHASKKRPNEVDADTVNSNPLTPHNGERRDYKRPMENRKAAMQDTALRLNEIAFLLRIAAAICHDS
ncbi:uncharacterized protein LDX57_008695 [Aspergillus melleus]|uniref:uncharacterized protein n=1 Tax=Aspergillus melleus TaxID=138277 RepID=UPI001E8EB933|nr:uncharacterized protein LDX57_008695 [Aspergillus melleus]KAH8431034.1 hypothetical protein LDX57_008695 [Aspergillus melleus]